MWAYTNGVTSNQLLSTVTFIGGGYLPSKFYELFSHIGRWWEYVRFKGVVSEDIECIAASKHKPHYHWRHWYLLGRKSNHSKLCINSTIAHNLFNNNWDGLCGKLRVLEQWYIHCSNCISAKVYDLYKPIRESFNQFSAERVLYKLGDYRQSVTLERGCLAC